MCYPHLWSGVANQRTNIRPPFCYVPTSLDKSWQRSRSTQRNLCATSDLFALPTPGNWVFPTTRNWVHCTPSDVQTERIRHGKILRNMLYLIKSRTILLVCHLPAFVGIKSTISIEEIRTGNHFLMGWIGKQH